MKKFILCIICAALLCSPLTVFAAMPKIVDDAGLLSTEDIADLETKAVRLAQQYDMDIIIVTVDSLGGVSSESFADDYYDRNGYGIGDDFSGILLLLSMEYRDWAISTCGNGIYALTDYGIQNIFSSIAGYLSNDQYYLAFSAYLDALKPYLEAFQNGKPIDGIAPGYQGPGTYSPGTQEEIVHFNQEKDAAWYLKRIGVSLVIGMIVGGIALLIMRRQMNTARRQPDAASYMNPNSYRVGMQRDIFLYSQLQKVRKQDNNHSSGGGSSFHRSSSGRSHGGGHGKF